MSTSGIKIAKMVTKLTADAIYAILEEVEKDGMQASDFLAPISDPQFQADFKLAIQELLQKSQPQG